MQLTQEQMIDHMVQNWEYLTVMTVKQFANVRAANHETDVQAFIRDALSKKTDEGEYLHNIEVIYEDTKENGELVVPFQVSTE